ncbi:MAG: hypothetical protein M3O46_16405 [Myxococcota bacterium]|nr:hypothetical protein [Myxococcota bacterium]
MVDSIDKLVQAWQRNPGAATTVALCEALRVNPRGALVQQVGEFAKEQLAGDVSVLVSVGRMYIQANRFMDAQAVLISAGKHAPREGRVYRWLGEVLLRRGDADRAEKVLQRAMQLGAGDPDVKIWIERARSYRALQSSAGGRAVAAEVAETAPTTPERARASPSSAKDSHSDEADTGEFELVHTGEIEITAPTKAPPPPKMSPVPKKPESPFAPPLPKKVAVGTNGAAVALPRAAPGHFENAIPADRIPVKPAPRARISDPGGLLVPHPGDVLDALTLAGMFEPTRDQVLDVVAWDHPGRGPRRKGGPTLIVGMVLFLAASIGIYAFYKHKRALEHVEAEALLSTVEARVEASKANDLDDAERDLVRVFHLESRSPRAAIDWARERAMVGLVKNGADVAFEDAMARAKDVGVAEASYAFARVASFLFQGDTAGAVGVLPRWEGAAGGDAWYQMIAGATLERAGDARARDRYATASKLDPQLVAARTALARATALDGDAQEAMRMGSEMRAAMPERAEPIALVALAWGRNWRREVTPAPAEVTDLAKRDAELPSGLKFVSHAIAALTALDRQAVSDARSEVQDGLAVADSPGPAVWLGTIAITIGDEALARKAALLALQFSAAYEPARALAARVALHGGRIDEALKATEDLDPAAPEVVVVRAASAYERVDADAVARALDALPVGTRKLPLFAALDLAESAISGRMRLDGAKLLTLAANDAPWADVMAMDLALAEGDLALADKIATLWGKDSESQPLRALRLARLARYEGRLDAADALSQTVLVHGTVTPRVLWERVYTLVAKDRSAEVGPLLARYPLVLGPLANWLSAYATASGGNADAAKGRTSSIDPPPQAAAFEARVVAASAFGAMKDRRRGTEYVRDVLHAGNLDPDLVAAAVSLGLRRVERGRRGPTYE